VLVSYPQGTRSQIAIGDGGRITGAVTTDQVRGVSLDATGSTGDIVFILTYNAVPESDQPTARSIATGELGESDSVTISAVGLTDGAVVTVHLSYSENDWIGGAETDLRLLRWNEDTGKYEFPGTHDAGVCAATGTAGDYGVCRDSHTVWAELTKLGTFRVGLRSSVDSVDVPVDENNDDNQVSGEDSQPPGDQTQPPQGSPFCGSVGLANGYALLMGLALMKRRNRISNR